MSPNCKIIFEPHNIDNASPATVSRNGMVYMSSSGLDWRPLMQGWYKTRNQRERNTFGELYELSFLQTYTWATQNLHMVMEILQCNIIHQMICILEGLIPSGKEDEEVDKQSNAGSEGIVSSSSSLGDFLVNYSLNLYVFRRGR